MMKFCFPEREAESHDFNDRASEDGEAEQKGKKNKSRRNRDSNFYVHIDDVEKMKVSIYVNNINKHLKSITAFSSYIAHDKTLLVGVFSQPIRPKSYSNPHIFYHS